MGMYTYRLVIESVESVQPLPCKEPVVGLNFRNPELETMKP